MSLLDVCFATNVNLLINACAEAGVIMVPYFTLRTLEEQAKLWRQSRTTEHINSRVEFLIEQGAPHLADILHNVGPCSGPEVTGALPGESWHNWGLACDCYWKVGSKAVWSGEELHSINGEHLNGYQVYWDAAKAQGLHTVTLRSGRKDWPHVQQPAESGPHKNMSWADIDKAMKERFG